MSSSNACIYLDDRQPDEGEIASLARKFYQDSNCQEGHDQENWLCAEYMLRQKHFIESQLTALHGHFQQQHARQ